MIDEPSRHFPDHIEIELHVDPDNLGESTGFMVPLYRGGKSVWHQGRDTTGEIDVAVIEIERAVLPVTTVYRAFTLDAEQPEVILARIQSNIESFRQRTSPPYRISLCIGIVQCNPSSDLTMSDYLSLADKQMYEQKNKSRSKPGIVD